MKNTAAAAKALESGIEGIFQTRRNQGQICNEIMIETKSGKALIGMIDRSLPESERIYNCKVVSKKGKTAYQICLEYAA